jgi:acetoin utilization deacetylase AcuC-like enzyme
MKVFHNDNYTASKYAFDTTRKSGAIAQRLALNPIDNLEIVDPDADYQDSDGTTWASSFGKVATERLRSLHSTTYVDAVLKGNPKGLAESQGFDWDEGVYKMAVAHATGLVAATSEALRNNTQAGSLSSGLHHAHIDHGAGFCTFNGLAAAADFAVKGWNLDRVLVIDFDAHSGGGTWEIINEHMSENVFQIDVTCSAYDTFKPTGESSIWYTGHQDYRETIDKALTYASKKMDKFDFIIYNAGMDPLNAAVSLSDIYYRENAVREFIGDTPAIFALAGGYTWGNKTMDDVVDWHSITLNTWADAQ